MPRIRTLDDLALAGRRVLVRVDFNVPLDKQLHVTSDARIRSALPTIRAILEAGGKPILMSHLGRPDGKVVESMRLAPAAKKLAELLGSDVRIANDCIGPGVERAIASLPRGACLVLENLRFYQQEEQGDAEFAKALAKLGDVYVNDAFGTAHRAHASVVGVAELLPSAAGLLMQRELEAFARVLEDPARPFCAILGGAKVSDKLPVIRNMLDKVDTLIVGGAMAYTFLAARGVAIGTSRCEKDLLAEAKAVEARAKERKVALLLPVDHVCSTEFNGAPLAPVGPAIPDGVMGLDIGPKSIAQFTAAIAKAKTIVWNGPMGVFENPAYRAGTAAVAHAVADADGFSVVGGGDSVAAVELLGVADRCDHVSTGGGASLELLEGQVLPGVAAVTE